MVFGSDRFGGDHFAAVRGDTLRKLSGREQESSSVREPIEPDELCDEARTKGPQRESMTMSSETFTPKLDDMVDALEESANVCFALDPDLRLIYCNPAWDEFAVGNDAPELASNAVIGTCLREVVGQELAPFYSAAFQKVEREHAAWECTYECSSPEVFRKFRMQIQPLAPSGYLVRNNLTVEHPHVPSAPAEETEYLDSKSLIILCMHCRSSQRANLPSHWDFVPAHLERRLTNVSHSLCPVCLEYFYPKE
jgi:hypothetical protein